MGAHWITVTEMRRKLATGVPKGTYFNRYAPNPKRRRRKLRSAATLSLPRNKFVKAKVRMKGGKIQVLVDESLLVSRNPFFDSSKPGYRVYYDSGANRWIAMRFDSRSPHMLAIGYNFSSKAAASKEATRLNKEDTARRKRS